MIEFGKTLREAREQKGYSVSQLAEITHILPQIIENLEHEDFSRIVAPIYGRGFVKLYCEAVGLEPKPLVEEFMNIFSGNRPPVIRMRAEETVSAATVPPPLETPPPPEEMPVVAEEPPLPPKAVELLETRRDEPESRADEVPPFGDDEPLPPSRRDYRLPGYSMAEVPKRYWRFGVLVLAAVLIVTLIVWGTRALYRATMTVPEGETEMSMEQQAYNNKNTEDVREGEGVTKDKTPRQGVKVPPLYID